MQFLDFEKPIVELEEKISALASSNNSQDSTIQKQIKTLQGQVDDLMKKVYGGLSDWQMIQLARHPQRPYFKDLVNLVFDDFQALHGDRAYRDDEAVIGGIAYLKDQPVMVIGQEKGRKTKDKLKHNFGMMHPEGYRKALRLMKLAEKFHMPVITFIDTPGAYPGIQAEERGQSEAIARNLFEMAKLQVPIVSFVIGEGCSGGALGIGVGDRLLMLEYSYFATISPEGCASILWKTAEKAPEASEIMGITSKRLYELGLVDEVVKEPLGGAHRHLAQAADLIRDSLTQHVTHLTSMTDSDRSDQRYARLMALGNFTES